MAAEGVNALNAIDFDFRGDECALRTIREAWREYRDHLNTKNSSAEAWNQRQQDLLVNLPEKMAAFLVYKELDKVELRKGFYAPQAHFTLAAEQQQIREGIAELLSGRRAIPMCATFLQSDRRRRIVDEEVKRHTSTSWHITPAGHAPSVAGDYTSLPWEVLCSFV